MIAFASLPDVDHRLPFVEHRGATHSLAFALAVGTALAGLCWVLVGRPAAPTDSELVVFAFAVGALSICSHLLGDVLTPAGIRPFWPLWNRRFTVRIVRAKNRVANYLFLAAGVFVTVGLSLSVGTV